MHKIRPGLNGVGEASPRVATSIPTRAFLKTIAWILIAAFAVQDVVWANPDIGKPAPGQNTLQIPSLFQHVRTDVYEKMLEAKLSFVLASIPDLKDFDYHLTLPIENEGVKFDLNFDHPYKEQDDTVIPCSLTTNRSCKSYEAVISPDRSIRLRKVGSKTPPVAQSSAEIVKMSIDGALSLDNKPKLPDMTNEKIDGKSKTVIKHKPSTRHLLWLRLKNIIARIKGINISYPSILIDLLKYDPKHILLITDFRTDKRRIGDSILFYSSFIHTLLGLYPESDVTIVTSQPELWNKDNNRLKIIPQEEILDIISKDEHAIRSDLEKLKKERGIDLLISLDRNDVPSFRQEAKDVFPVSFFANAGNGALLKTPESEQYLPLLPWTDTFYKQLNIEGQGLEFERRVLEGSQSYKGDLLLNIKPDDRNWLRSLLGSGNNPVLLLNIFSMREWKDWRNIDDIVSFMKIVIGEKGMKVVMPAPRSADQQRFLIEISRSIPAELRKRLIIPDRGSLHSLKLLLYASDYVVTVDTGTSHLAAALGKEPIVLYYRSFRNKTYFITLPWLPFTTKKKGSYVSSAIPSRYPPENILEKINSQQLRRQTGKEEAIANRCKIVTDAGETAPNIEIKGAQNLRIAYDRKLDILTIVPDGYMPYSPLLNTASVIYGDKINQAVWAYHRTKTKNFTYLDETAACVEFSDKAHDNLVYDESGLVYMHGVAGISVIKSRDGIKIYGKDNFREAADKLTELMKDRQLVYRRPEHILERVKGKITEKGVVDVVSRYYGMDILKAGEMLGGRAPGTVFLVETKDAHKYVFKFLGKDRKTAERLIDTANKLKEFCPYPMKLTKHDDNTTGDYLVSTNGEFAVLEEYIGSKKTDIYGAGYYRDLGRRVAEFHKRSGELKKYFNTTGENMMRGPDAVSAAMMKLELLVAKSNVLNKGKSINELESYFAKISDSLIEQSENIVNIDIEKILQGSAVSVLHNDLSRANVMKDAFDNLRFIDLETSGFGRRVLDFPLAIVGVAAYNPLVYVPGSFQDFIDGYNSCSDTPLTDDEILAAKWLIIHKFLLRFMIDAIKNPTSGVDNLSELYKAFNAFCAECPIGAVNSRKEDKMLDADASLAKVQDNGQFNEAPPRRVPFAVNYPLDIFEDESPDILSVFDDPEALKRRLSENIYYAQAPPDRKQRMYERVLSLKSVLPAIEKYFTTNHPELKIINISLFGSYGYADDEASPSDIDFLVTVHGNIFALEEIQIDPHKDEFSKNLPASVKSLSFSIKGDENLCTGAIDTGTKVRPQMQKIVLDRTVTTLRARHIVISGRNFRDGLDLIKKNGLAHISDLLFNAYIRLYDIDVSKSESDVERLRKVLVRLYDVAVYMEYLYPGEGADPERIYQLRIKYVNGQAGQDEIFKEWKNAISIFNRVQTQAKQLFAFDYDGTLADTGKRMGQDILEQLAYILLSGHAVAIVTARNKEWFEKNNISISSSLKDAIVRLRPAVTRAELNKYIENLFMFTARGAEKYYYRANGDVLNEIMDTSYSSSFDESGVMKIKSTIHAILSSKGVEGDLLEETMNEELGGVVNIRVLFKLGSKGDFLKEEIADEIKKAFSHEKKLASAAVEIYGKGIGINPKNKSAALRHIIEKMGYGNVDYCGNESSLGDKSVFELAQSFKMSTLTFTEVSGPDKTLEFIRSCRGRSPPVLPLGILKNKRIKEFVLKRMKQYWTLTKFPVEWLDDIIGDLEKYSDNEEVALRVVQEKFPQLTDKESAFNKKLRAWREVKVKNLAHRVADLASDGVLMDFGGRVTDLAEEMLKQNSSLQKIIVTDVLPPDKESNNSHIEFMTQPELFATSMPPSSVDTVFACMAMHHMDHLTRQRALNHLYTILRPGGRIIIIEDSYPRNSDLSRQEDGLMKEFLSFSAQEKFDLLCFFDWFGNCLTRYRSKSMLTYAYEPMEYWERMLYGLGMKKIESQFVTIDPGRLDLIPPKALFVFEKEPIDGLSKPLQPSNGYNEKENIESINGVELRYMSIGEGEPIVVLHGGPGTGYQYLLASNGKDPNPFLELSKNHRLIFYDQRASGGSTGREDTSQITLENFIKDLEGLREKLGLEKINIIGHSWGAFLAMVYAARYPDRVNSAILANPMPPSDEKVKQFLGNRSNLWQSIGFDVNKVNMRGDEAVGEYWEKFFSIYFHNPEDAKAFNGIYTTRTLYDTKLSFKAMKELLKKDFYPLLADLRCPVLMLSGDKDMMGPSYYRDLSTAIGGTTVNKDSMVEMAEFKDCGHFSFIESPKEFFTKADAFLKNVQNNQTSTEPNELIKRYKIFSEEEISAFRKLVSKYEKVPQVLTAEETYRLYVYLNLSGQLQEERFVNLCIRVAELKKKVAQQPSFSPWVGNMYIGQTIGATDSLNPVRSYLGEIKHGDMVLDIGFAIGAEMVDLAKDYPGANFIMANPEITFVRRAIEKAEKQEPKLNNLQISPKIFQELKIPSGSVKHIIVRNIFFDMDTKVIKNILKELLRIATPNATIMITGYSKLESDSLKLTALGVRPKYNLELFKEVCDGLNIKYQTDFPTPHKNKDVRVKLIPPTTPVLTQQIGVEQSKGAYATGSKSEVSGSALRVSNANIKYKEILDQDYKSRVELVVLKDGSRLLKKSLPKLFGSKWLARWHMRRQFNAILSLQGISGMPELIGGFDELENAFYYRYIEGKTIDKVATVNDRFFDALYGVMQSMWDRGWAHCALNACNILIGDDGQPYIIDFESAVHRGSNFLSKWFFDRMKTENLYHFYKRKQQLRPDLTSSEERHIGSHSSWLRTVYNFVYFKPYKFISGFPGRLNQIILQSGVQSSSHMPYSSRFVLSNSHAGSMQLTRLINPLFFIIPGVAIIAAVVLAFYHGKRYYRIYEITTREKLLPALRLIAEKRQWDTTRLRQFFVRPEFWYIYFDKFGFTKFRSNIASKLIAEADREINEHIEQKFSKIGFYRWDIRDILLVYTNYIAGYDWDEIDKIIKDILSHKKDDLKRKANEGEADVLGQKHIKALDMLGLPYMANWDQVKKRHRQLALQLHPDNYRGPKEEAEEKFKIVQEAYKNLEEPRAKRILEKSGKRYAGHRNYSDKLKSLVEKQTREFAGMASHSSSYVHEIPEYWRTPDYWQVLLPALSTEKAMQALNLFTDSWLRAVDELKEEQGQESILTLKELFNRAADIIGEKKYQRKWRKLPGKIVSPNIGNEGDFLPGSEGKLNEKNYKQRPNLMLGKGSYATGLEGRKLPKLEYLQPKTIATLSKNDLLGLIGFLENRIGLKQIDVNDIFKGADSPEAEKLRRTFLYMIKLAQENNKFKKLLLMALRSPPLSKDESNSNLNVSSIEFVLSDNLTIDAARYHDPIHNKASIAFNTDFFNLDKYVKDSFFDDTILHIRMTRIMHELVHDNKCGKWIQEILEESRVIGRLDMLLWEITKDIGMQAKIDTLRSDGKCGESVQKAMHHSGRIFKMMDGWQESLRALSNQSLVEEMIWRYIRGCATTTDKDDTVNGKAFGMEPNTQNTQEELRPEYLDFDNTIYLSRDGIDGPILKVRHKTTGQWYVAKIFIKAKRKEGMACRARYLVDLCREHPDLVEEGLMPRYYLYNEDKIDQPYLLMEYIPSSNLSELMKSGHTNGHVQAVSLIPSIAKAVYEFHRAGLLIKELKPENILIRENGKVCISDLDGAVPLGYDWTKNPLNISESIRWMHTPYYSESEEPFAKNGAYDLVSSNELFDSQWDVYSLGMIIMEILDNAITSDHDGYVNGNFPEFYEIAENCLRGRALRYKDMRDVVDALEAVGKRKWVEPLEKTVSSDIGVEVKRKVAATPMIQKDIPNFNKHRKLMLGIAGILILASLDPNNYLYTGQFLQIFTSIAGIALMITTAVLDYAVFKKNKTAKRVSGPAIAQEGEKLPSSLGKPDISRRYYKPPSEAIERISRESQFETQLSSLANSIMNRDRKSTDTVSAYFKYTILDRPKDVKEKLINALRFESSLPNQVYVNTAVLRVMRELPDEKKTPDLALKASKFLNYTGVGQERLREEGRKFFESIPDNLVFKTAEKRAIEDIEKHSNDMDKSPLLTHVGEIKLIVLAKMGSEEARKKIVESYSKLIAPIAEEYGHSGLPFMDLMDKGSINLIMAIDEYDLQDVGKFSTYATYAIKRGIIGYIANGGKRINVDSPEEAGKKEKYKDFTEALDTFVSGKMSWDKTTNKMREDFVVMLAKSLGKEPGLLNTWDFTKPIPEFKNRRLNHLLHKYTDKGRISDKEALKKLKYELGIKDMLDSVRYKDFDEALGAFLADKISWNRTTPEIRLKFIEMLAMLLGKEPGAIDTGDFRKAIPKLNNKRLSHLLYLYTDGGRIAPKDAVKILKRKLGIKDSVEKIHTNLQEQASPQQVRISSPTVTQESEKLSTALGESSLSRRYYKPPSEVIEKWQQGWREKKRDWDRVRAIIKEYMGVNIEGENGENVIALLRNSELTKEVDIALGREVRLGDSAARECMIEAYTKDVEYLAGVIHRGNPDLEIDELKHKGMVALAECVEQFNPEKNISFAKFISGDVRYAPGKIQDAMFRRKRKSNKTKKAQNDSNGNVSSNDLDIYMFYLEGMSLSEIAEKKGITPTAVGHIVNKCKKAEAFHEPLKMVSPNASEEGGLLPGRERLHKQLPEINSKTKRDTKEPIQFLRDVINPEELSQNMIEGILSALFSNREVTLAFDKNLKGLESEQLRAMVRQLAAWKEAMIRKNPKMKALLERFNVFAYDNLKEELDKRGIDVNAKDGLILNYAPKPQYGSEDTSKFGSAIKPVYIIEPDSGFPNNFYYPLLEMVTVSLAKELLQWDENQLREALTASDITIDAFGIDAIIDEKLGMLIFKVLPRMERYDNNSRIDRYTRLMQFLRAA